MTPAEREAWEELVDHARRSIVRDMQMTRAPLIDHHAILAADAELTRLQGIVSELREEMVANNHTINLLREEVETLEKENEKDRDVLGADIKRLREAVEWAIDNVDWDDTAVLKEMTGIGELDDDEKAYLNRRQAGGEG
jgi:chromosome segregation ATPase